VTAILASDVSARIEALVARYDRGDRYAAARRLGVQPDRLAGLMSGDWSRFSLDALAALTLGYGVRVESLLAPRAAPSTAATRALVRRPVSALRRTGSGRKPWQ
jgi:hypothetical protein